MIEILIAFAAGAASCFAALFISAGRRRRRAAPGENSKERVGETVVAVLSDRPVAAASWFQRHFRRFSHAHP